MSNILLNLWVTILNNENKEYRNYKDNPATENSVENAEIDFPPDTEDEENLQKVDDDEYAP